MLSQLPTEWLLQVAHTWGWEGGVVFDFTKARVIHFKPTDCRLALWSPSEADKRLTRAGLAASGLASGTSAGLSLLGFHFLPAWRSRTKSYCLPPVMGLCSATGLLMETWGLCRTFTSPRALRSSLALRKQENMAVSHQPPCLDYSIMILFKLSSQLQQGCESEFIVSQLSFHLGQKKKKNKKAKKQTKKNLT